MDSITGTLQSLHQRSCEVIEAISSMAESLSKTGRGSEAHQDLHQSGIKNELTYKTSLNLSPVGMLARGRKRMKE